MQKILSLLPKPSRYLGIEEGSIHKDPTSVRLRVALAFPDMYEVGMSYLGHKILYSIINEVPHWQAERVFTPCKDAGQILQQHNTSLATLESGTPLAATDAIGFSMTHELCYTNVLYMLDLAGIPFLSAERNTPQNSGKPWPIIMAGGGCTLAAEPMAPYIDMMMLGEGEEVLVEVLQLLENSRNNNDSRYEFLCKARHIPGVYIPEFFIEDASGSLAPLFDDYTSVTRRVIPDMNDAPYPATQPIPFGAVHNRLALEIGRGCTRGCRFCQAGAIYRPARERSVDNLVQTLNTCLTDTGFDDVSFLSLSTGDFSALKSLFMQTVERCTAEQISVSLPSLRVGSIDDDIMGRMAGIRRTGATLAPEAGSQRLRDVINKGITEEQLILHTQKLFEHGWQQIKLYFMIGLPTETDDDLRAIIDLCCKARDSAGPGVKRLQITAAVSPFVPKPHTPFQWAEQISLEETRRRIGVLLDAIKHEKRLKLRWHLPEMTALEGIFSRGDRKLAPVIAKAYAKGATFSSWIEGFSLHHWHEALEEEGITATEYIAARNVESVLPWDHLASGLDKQFFIRDWQRALETKTVEDCRYNVCLQCGVCDTKARPSLLDKPTHPFGDFAKKEENSDFTYFNRLNVVQRDQATHTVALDEHGRVIVRNEHNNVPKRKQLPPKLPEHLARKTMNVLVTYARQNEAAYLSQLEMQAIIERALRRAQLPISFSQGYHPLPLLSFGRALPVGVASEGEKFSIILSEHISTEDIFKKLGLGLPKGLFIRKVEEISLKDKKLASGSEKYRIDLLQPDKADTFAAALQSILNAKSIIWQRETKKGIQEIDARCFFTDINFSGTTGTISFCWEKRYVSPLALTLAAFSSVGYIDKEIDFSLFLLTKLSDN